MSAASQMSLLQMFEDSASATGSEELASGRTLCDSPECPTIAKSGRQAAHVSRSAPPASAKRKKTQDIFGPNFIDSFENASQGSLLASKSPAVTSSASLSNRLSLMLAKRLEDITSQLGSTMFSLTWKAQATPAGRLIPRLRASALRTFASDCTGWPSTQKHDAVGGKTPEQIAVMRAQGHGVANLNVCNLAPWPSTNCPNGGRVQSDEVTISQRRPDGSKAQAGLENVARLSSWPDPSDACGQAKRAANPERSNDLNDFAMLASWGTPRVTTNGGHPSPDVTGKGSRLEDQAALASWGTPAARDWRDGRASEATMTKNSRPLNEQAVNLSPWNTPRGTDGSNGGPNQAGGALSADAALAPWPTPESAALSTDSGLTPTGSPAQTGKRGQLNPALSRWLMALPQEFCDCAVLAMESYQRRPRRLSARLSRKSEAETMLVKPPKTVLSMKPQFTGPSRGILRKFEECEASE
jgi:hypothetical protein